ncbi:MAG: efflux RND transporter periplasmic adaptor subunit [Melioribacteraceae bacterium]|nr:efflux RND transporter periplasmic adaptor subunit [Melioribacteraceae bacterium]
MANGKKNNKKKFLIFGGLGLLVVVVILLVVFSGNKEEIITVQTEKATKKTITQVVTATGKINPVFQVMISAEATGEIVELPIEEGDIVKKGQLLLKIKPDTYLAQKNRAEASLQQSRASLNSRKAALEQVEMDYKRYQSLFDKGLASDAEIQNSKSSYLQRLGEYNAQQSMVIQAEATLKEANETLYKTTIYSPINGTISKLNVELSERVLGSGFSPGTQLLTVADLSEIEANVEVDENDVVLITVGDTAKINIDAFGEKVFKGVVTQIGNSALSSGLGTQDEVVNFEVKILLTSLDQSIRSGMSCDADIITETKNNVLAVPIQSVTGRLENAMKAPVEKPEEDGAVIEKKNGESKANKPKEVVFTVVNSEAIMKDVKAGISDDTYIEIISGLNEGDEVVTGPYKSISKDLENKSKVSVQSRGGNKNKK